MKFFVTGTDTNVGKTFISAMLCGKYKLNYFKPIQTGLQTELDSDSEFIKKFVNSLNYKNNKNITVIDSLIKMKSPLSPLAAAIKEKKHIEITSLIKETNKIISQNKNLIIEGAGGIFVPIGEDFFMIDFIKQLNIPVVIVIEDKLGCINHSIMTINEIINRDIKIAQIILNKATSKNKYSNYAIIKEYIQKMSINVKYYTVKAV